MLVLDDEPFEAGASQRELQSMLSFRIYSPTIVNVALSGFWCREVGPLAVASRQSLQRQKPETIKGPHARALFTPSLLLLGQAATNQSNITPNK
jgi:hypothetical protein